MWKRNSFLLRLIALVLVFTISTQVLFPSVAYALTSGPSAPEFSSFEPVDATDMVNLATGDFTYTMPVFEVPSPEGSYPLALSYHAGIQPDQEASWVGLGWTLNAGSINRYVSLLPDDVANDISVIDDIWEGGSIQTYSGGIGIACVHAGISIANDTYRGVGVGFNASVVVPYTNAGTLGGGLGLHVGTNPYGGGYYGIGYSISTPGAGVNASVEVGYYTVVSEDGSTNDFFTAGVGIGYSNESKKNNFSGSILGASISTANNSGPSYSVLGVQASYDGVKGDGIVSVLEDGSLGLTIPIPLFDIPVWVDFSFSKQRYFLENISNTFGYGSLYLYKTQFMGSDYSKGLFDIYTLKGQGSKYSDNTSSVNGGAFPAVDNYSVNAQGIGGSISPCQFEYETLPGHGRTLTTNAQEYNHKMSFRFVNDFANAFRWDVPLDAINASSETDWDNFLETNSRKVGLNGTDYNSITTLTGFDKNRNMLSSSSHVEHYTNYEIVHGQAPGLIVNDNPIRDFTTLGYTLTLSDNIGAFKITNKTGVTYHFSLPVYNFEEGQQINSSKTKRIISKAMPYAYTWLLTAVTGPDFVDRGLIGQVDEDDYGYWVKFDYGKWSDQCAWRTPNQGFKKDADSEYESASYGKKQVYYLNSITTRTHTALFVKELRKDGRGIASKSNGGFNVSLNEGKVNEQVPVGSLKLSSILLCQNADLNTWLASNISSTDINSLYAKNGTIDYYTKAGNAQRVDVQEWNNVLDVMDLASYNLATDIAQKQVVFNTTYDLCKNTPNSFAVKNTFEQQGALDGKLTLKSISPIERNGKVLIPPTSFDYNNPNPDYDQNKQDVWGNYKSDYIDLDNKEVKQICTNTSAPDVDAWSLSKINTSMGASISIEYESDQYYLAEGLSCFNNLSIKDVVADATSQSIKIYLFSSEHLNNVTELIGGNVSAKLFLRYNRLNDGLYKDCGVEDQNVKIKSIGTDVKGEYILVDPLDNTTYAMLAAALTDPVGTPVYTFNAGNIVLNSQGILKYGGGHRVKSISVSDGKNSFATVYDYEDGYTSYEPIDFNIHVINESHLNSADLDKMKDDVYKYYLPVLSSLPFVPSPGIIYSKVTVSDEVKDSYTQVAPNRNTYYSEGYTEFNFITAHELPNLSAIRKDILLFGSNNKTFVEFHDFTNRIGLLKSVIRYKSDETVLSSNENNYSLNNTELLEQNFNYQGTLEQLFRESKEFGNRVTYTKISQTPIIQVGQTNTDNKTGLVRSSMTIGFDFFSGDATAVLSTDASGNQFLSVTQPAYPNTSMGLKTDNTDNKNMLGQVASSVTYKVSLLPGLSEYNVNSYTQLGVISASANVWNSNNTWSIPRLKSTYSWVGEDEVALNLDGSYPYSSFHAFNGNDIAQPGWQLNSRIISYDNYSHPILSEDVNGNHSVVFMDPTMKYVTFSADNALDKEVACSGAEFPYSSTGVITDGNVSYTESDNVFPVNGLQANTGAFSISVNSGYEGFSTMIISQANRVYETGVWVYMPGEAETDLTNAQLIVYNGNNIVATFSPNAIKKSGSNYLISGSFKASPTGGNYRVVCKTKNTSPRALFFDDFYVKPLTSTVTSFVYDTQLGKLTHIIDNNKMYMRYEYNEGGKLTKIFKQIMDIKKEYLMTKNKMHYGKNN